MNALEIFAIIAVSLFFILLFGVGYIVIKFLKELLDSKALEKQEAEALQESKTDTDKHLRELKKKYQELNQKYQRVSEMQKEIDEMELDVKEIFAYGQKLTELNDFLYDKISVIHSVLDKKPTPEQIEKLRETIQNDIMERKEYQDYLKKHEQERRQRVKGSFYHGLSR